MSKAKRTKHSAPKKAASKTRSRGYPDQNRGERGKPKSGPSVQAQTSKSKQKSPSKQRPNPQASQTGFSVPFAPTQRILLLGEGDFSFSASLLTTHHCADLTATTFESRTGLVEKYPQASSSLHTLASSTPPAKIFYNIDATALLHPTRGGGSHLRKLAPFSRIVFNFPHTGGLTKDVNRQVRANQELCVKFLESAAKPELLAHSGRIVVTLFEGEPYELWGIRNLARHVGLVVVRSTKFEWESYPGYRHARTLGNLRGEGAWKGEERDARMYVFARKGEEQEVEDGVGQGSSVSKKRKRHANDSNEDEDEEAYDDEAGSSMEEAGDKAEDGEANVHEDEQALQAEDLNNKEPGSGGGDSTEDEFEGFGDD